MKQERLVWLRQFLKMSPEISELYKKEKVGKKVTKEESQMYLMQTFYIYRTWVALFKFNYDFPTPKSVLFIG